MPKDYPYIRAWCALLGSFQYYVENQISLAQDDNAPDDAIYEKRGSGGAHSGEWVRFSEVTNQSSRDFVEAWVENYNTVKETKHV